MHRECETMEPDFDCEPVEPLDMEVDDIVIDSDEIKSDNDLCPIANDPFVEPAEPKHFDEGIHLTCLILQFMLQFIKNRSFCREWCWVIY